MGNIYKRPSGKPEGLSIQLSLSTVTPFITA